LQKVLQKFDINSDTKSVGTSLAPHFKLKAIMSPTTVEERKYMSHVSMPMQWVACCMLWCIRDPICHKPSA